MGSQIFFLDKKSGTSQKKSQLFQNLSSHKKINKSRKMSKYTLYYIVSCNFECNITLFCVLSFCIFWRCSAGSEIFFLDKKSETSQKNCSSPKISAPTRKSINLENVKICTTFTISCNFWIRYHVILCFDFWFLLKVLCGISDIFPWQIIWDLSKKIAALPKSQLSQENQRI